MVKRFPGLARREGDCLTRRAMPVPAIQAGEWYHDQQAACIDDELFPERSPFAHRSLH